MRLSFLRQYNIADAGIMMALLFGAAGLLPSERLLSAKAGRMYVRPLRQQWKRSRPSYKGRILQPGDWLFFRLRPGNFPTARLASMCFLLPSLFGEEGFRSLISSIKKDGVTSRARIEACRVMFKVTPDEFWRHHYRFDQAPSPHGLTIGAERINDLLVNGVLPIVLLYARLFKDQSVRTNALRMLAALPPPQENSITRILQRQLLKKKTRFASALGLQGGIHLYKFFCAPVRCSECEIGRHLGIDARGRSPA